TAVDRRRPFLTWDFVAAVRADAARVRGHRAELDAELRRGVLGAVAGDELDGDPLFCDVRALSRGATRGSARTAHACRDVEDLPDFRELALHLLIGLELVDEAALQAAAHTRQLGLVQR